MMIAIRISAILAILFGVIIALTPFIPVYYGLPLHLKVGIDDVTPMVSCIALLAGGLLTLSWRQTSILIAAWSWMLALHVSSWTDGLAHPPNYSAAIANAGTPAKQALMRQVFEKAVHSGQQLGFIYSAICLIALILVLIGQSNNWSAQRAVAV